MPSSNQPDSPPDAHERAQLQHDVALDLYDRALVQACSFLHGKLHGPWPAVLQESIDLAQAGYLAATGREPKSLLQLAPAELERNPLKA